MQNDSALSKPKVMIDNRKLPCWSAGEKRRESFRKAHGKGYELQPQASATHFLICLPSPCCLGWQARQRWAWPLRPWIQNVKWHIFHL